MTLKRILVFLMLVSAGPLLAGTFTAHGSSSGGSAVYRVRISETSVDAIEVVSARLVATYGGRIEPFAEEGFRGFLVSTTEQRAKLLSNDADVVSVEEVARGGTRSVSPPPPSAAAPQAASAAPIKAVAAAVAPPKMHTDATASWQSGTYQYDGAGNITTIGLDVYTYDLLSRLKSGSINRSGVSGEQTYDYDAFGNLTKIESTAAPCVNGPCSGGAISVAPTTNHLMPESQYAYDSVGNVTRIGSTQLIYDDVGVVQRQTSGGVDRQYVYDANDERIAVYSAGAWQWTVRGPHNEVLREYTSTDAASTFPLSTNWQWKEDYLYRGSQLLATETAAGRRHFHLDHLGTPRVVTDDAGRQIAVHAYYPFGAELSLGQTETPTESHKFTGHERDTIPGDVNSLDYMHARYYAANLGRFLSVDPTIAVQRNMHQPQGWNRYAYAMNSPIVRVDPDGRKDTIYIINTLGGNAFGKNAMDKLTAMVKGTRFEGHIQVIGPMASNGMVRAWMGHADRTDMTAVLIHSGGTKDWKPSLGGFMMTQANLGNVSKGISGATIANWAADGQPPGACMVAGCHSQQIAATISSRTGTFAFGTTQAAVPYEQGMAAAALLGSLAQGKTATEAAAAATAEYHTPANDCNQAGPGCDPTAIARVVVEANGEGVPKQ